MPGVTILDMPVKEGNEPAQYCQAMRQCCAKYYVCASVSHASNMGVISPGTDMLTNRDSQ